MVSVFDVAKYILHRQGKISTWKLQKLCYYAQAWSIAWTEQPLFQEDFQAWSNGPVCVDLFHKHQGKFYAEESDVVVGNIDKLSSDDKDTIDIVLRDYGNMEPYDLRELTHKEDPWRIARNGLPEGASSATIISKESMGEYYGSL